MKIIFQIMIDYDDEVVKKQWDFEILIGFYDQFSRERKEEGQVGSVKAIQNHNLFSW